MILCGDLFKGEKDLHVHVCIRPAGFVNELPPSDPDDHGGHHGPYHVCECGVEW